MSSSINFNNGGALPPLDSSGSPVEPTPAKVEEEPPPKPEELPQSTALEKQQDMQRIDHERQTRVLADLPKNDEQLVSQSSQSSGLIKIENPIKNLAIAMTENQQPINDRELAFVNFLVSVFTHGILSGVRAQELGIITTNSVDHTSAPAQQIRVNMILEQRAISKAIFNAANGALPIALERTNDSLLSDTDKIALTAEERKAIGQEVREKYGQNPDEITKKQAQAEFEQRKGAFLQQKKQEARLNALSERAHRSVFIVATPSTLTFTDNKGNDISKSKKKEYEDFFSVEKNRRRDGPVAHEKRITGNLPAEGFAQVLLPQRYEKYKENFPEVMRNKLVFISSITTEVAYNYGIGASQLVKINVPNYEALLEQFWEETSKSAEQPFYIMTHLSRSD